MVGKNVENGGWIFSWIFKLDIHFGGNWIFKTLAKAYRVEEWEKSKIGSRVGETDTFGASFNGA